MSALTRFRPGPPILTTFDRLKGSAIFSAFRCIARSNLRDRNGSGRFATASLPKHLHREFREPSDFVQYHPHKLLARSLNQSTHALSLR